MIVQLLTKVLLGVFFKVAEETPVHVDVPDERVCGIDHVHAEVDPEHGIRHVFEARVAAIGRGHIDAKQGRQDACEVLASVDQVALLLALVEFEQALGKPEPVGQESDCLVEPVGRRALPSQVCHVRVLPIP